MSIDRPSAESAVVKFWPSDEQQRELAAEGLQGQLVVKYDVDRMSRPGEVLVRKQLPAGVSPISGAQPPVNRI